MNLLEADDDDVRAIATRKRNALLQTIANLTILARELNVAQSNSAWKDKKPELMKHSCSSPFQTPGGIISLRWAALRRATSSRCDGRLEQESALITSGLSHKFTRDGIKVEVCIYRLETEPGWSLEVVNSAGTSIVWQEEFPSDDAANKEFLRTVTEEGMAVLVC